MGFPGSVCSWVGRWSCLPSPNLLRSLQSVAVLVFRRMGARKRLSPSLYSGAWVPGNASRGDEPDMHNCRLVRLPGLLYHCFLQSDKG
jgi:hypothetical protein